MENNTIHNLINSCRLVHYTGRQFDFAFYILMKGQNAGRPSLEFKHPNSLCIICKDEQAKLLLYSYAFVIFESRAYFKYLKGSVIPFIRIADVKELFQSFSFISIERLNKTCSMLNDLRELENNINTQLKLLRLARASTAYKCRQRE